VSYHRAVDCYSPAVRHIAQARYTRGALREYSMRSSFYMLSSSAFGTLGLVWQEAEKGPRVQRVFLPSVRRSVEEVVEATFPGARPSSCLPITELGERIQRFLAGQAVDFELELIALGRCSEFQARVLVAEYEIPRGWVGEHLWENSAEVGGFWWCEGGGQSAGA